MLLYVTGAVLLGRGEYGADLTRVRKVIQKS
jgi:hypothetical protein